LADSIYNALQHGADFGAMAKEFSNDRATYFNGGEMPEFGVAKYNPAFEKAAFSLTKDNEISQPFETEFGFHILKRIAAIPVPASKNEEAFMYHLKQEILKDSRIESAKQQFVNDILPKIGYKKMTINVPDLWRVSDSSLMANKNITSGSVNEKTILFSYNDHSKVKVSDWILFIKNSNKIIPEKLHESYAKLWPEFISFSAVENYRKRLQNFSPEFKDQLQEFKDGNMLFEIMERKVWAKAAADSAGLLQFYNQHQQKYVWNASAAVIIFSCANETVARESSEELQKGKLWKEVMNDHSSQVQADSGRYELSQIPVVDRTHLAEGLITQPVVNKNDGTAVFTKIIKLYPANQQRSFEDARGLVINDYQHILEEEWIGQLKIQYPIKINKKVFQALLQ
jgi:peptidyl-prolyl cis-trans isomerase SurA